ncbi:MAG: hypothetical protein SGBAC_010230 [Bacillariaceae sp.]
MGGLRFFVIAVAAVACLHLFTSGPSDFVFYSDLVPSGDNSNKAKPQSWNNPTIRRASSSSEDTAPTERDLSLSKEESRDSEDTSQPNNSVVEEDASVIKNSSKDEDRGQPADEDAEEGDTEGSDTDGDTEESSQDEEKSQPADGDAEESSQDEEGNAEESSSDEDTSQPTGGDDAKESSQDGNAAGL